MEDNVFGERLRKLRLERGKTIYNVADDFYLSASVIGCYERGVNEPPLGRVTAFAKYYGVSTDYLLGMTDIRTADNDMKCACIMTGFSNEIIEMLHYLSGISWAKEMIGDAIRAMMGGVSMQQFEEHFQKGEIKNAE